MCLNPDIKIAEEDYIMIGPVYGDKGTQRLHAICLDRGITHLIYSGVATNICVVGKAPGAMYMGRAGVNIILARFGLLLRVWCIKVNSWSVRCRLKYNESYHL